MRVSSISLGRVQVESEEDLGCLQAVVEGGVLYMEFGCDCGMSWQANQFNPEPGRNTWKGGYASTHGVAGLECRWGPMEVAEEPDGTIEIHFDQCHTFPWPWFLSSAEVCAVDEAQRCAAQRWSCYLSGLHEGEKPENPVRALHMPERVKKLLGRQFWKETFCA